MDNEEMGKKLIKNFKEYINVEKYNKQLKEDQDDDNNDDDEETKEEKKERKPKRHDFDVYRRLVNENGKTE